MGSVGSIKQMSFERAEELWTLMRVPEKGSSQWEQMNSALQKFINEGDGL